MTLWSSWGVRKERVWSLSKLVIALFFTRPFKLQRGTCDNRPNLYSLQIVNVHICTVEPPIMNFPNSKKPLIMKFFPCILCMHFNRFVPLNKENNEKNWLSQNFHYSEVPLYTEGMYVSSKMLVFTFTHTSIS